MTAENILSLFQSDDEIQLRHEGEKVFLTLYVKQYPYHDDAMDFIELDFSNNTISFFEQYRILFQNLIEKIFNGKDEHERLNRCYTKFASIITCFKPIDIELLNRIMSKINANNELEEIKADYILLCKQLEYPYKESATLKALVDKIIKLIASEYTKSLVCREKLIFSFEFFEWLYTASKKKLKTVFQKIVASILGFLYGKQITEKIRSCIYQKYLYCADMSLVLNASAENSVIISLENNPWRNGVMNGDKFFARINADEETKYIVFNPSSEYLFENKQSISFKTELNEFMEHLEKRSQVFISLINTIFLKAISFSEFGCCSKHEECEKQGKCLHTDQLYATACQWRNHIKGSGKYDSSKEKTAG